MLVLTRRENETVHIGKEITVTVVSVRGNKVRLAFEAPIDVPIHRAEVQRRLDDQQPHAVSGPRAVQPVMQD
jgi:carbon storage regulator